METRNLLSLLGSKPTLDAIIGPGVHRNHQGGISITQPAMISVHGTAQPGPAGATVEVSIYAEDARGNIVNGGAPLATTTPDSLGRYSATISLPSTIRKDTNFLVAKETATYTQLGVIAINGTTISNLKGDLAVNPGTLSGLTGNLAIAPTTLSNLTATTSTTATPITGIGGTITTPATSITGITGTINTPAIPITGGGGGTVGASTGQLVGGTGTLSAQTGTLVGGTGTLSAGTGTLTGGRGTIAATTGTLTQTGTAAESGRTGTFSNGTGDIAPTTGTLTQQIDEVAVSDPLLVRVHQPNGTGIFFTSVHHAAVKSHAVHRVVSHRSRA